MDIENLGFELDDGYQIVFLWCSLYVIVYGEVGCEFVDDAIWDHLYVWIRWGVLSPYT